MASKKNRGFTLIEILIAFAVLTLLALMGFMAWQNQVAKARDARRKDDIKRLNIAFEDYYGDKECYPPANILVDCGDADHDQLKPYLDQPIPCDPLTDNPYCYVSDGTDCSQEFRILASLENDHDPDIGKLGCASTTAFCGYETECADFGSGFNYGFSSTNIAVLNPAFPFVGFGASSGASLTPSGAPLGSPHPYGGGYIYACVGSEGGDCNSWSYSVPGCYFFNNLPECDTMCLNEANWCCP